MEIRKLLTNVRKVRLAPADIAATAAFFDQLGDEQVDNLAAGLFGIYTDAGSAAATQDNVRSLWPEIWEYLPDGSRYGFGTRYGRFLANADQDKAVLARELLDLVEAAAYFPEPVRVAELDRALDELLTAHHGFNNFYNEPPLARQLAELVGEKGDVPAPVRGKYVHTLVEVFLTNGNGVAFSADPVYRSLLQELDSGLAAVALRSFTDAVIANRLQFSLTDLRGTPVAAATSDLVGSASERSRRIRRPSAARKARRARTRRPGSGPQPPQAGSMREIVNCLLCDPIGWTVRRPARLTQRRIPDGSTATEGAPDRRARIDNAVSRHPAFTATHTGCPTLVPFLLAPTKPTKRAANGTTKATVVSKLNPIPAPGGPKAHKIPQLAWIVEEASEARTPGRVALNMVLVPVQLHESLPVLITTAAL